MRIVLALIVVGCGSSRSSETAKAPPAPVEPMPAEQRTLAETFPISDEAFAIGEPFETKRFEHEVVQVDILGMEPKLPEWNARTAWRYVARASRDFARCYSHVVSDDVMRFADLVRDAFVHVELDDLGQPVAHEITAAEPAFSACMTSQLDKRLARHEPHGATIRFAFALRFGVIPPPQPHTVL